MEFYLDHRATATSHCSLPVSENGSETGHFQNGFQVVMIDPIECFALTLIDQGHTEARFCPSPFCDVSQAVMDRFGIAHICVSSIKLLTENANLFVNTLSIILNSMFSKVIGRKFPRSLRCWRLSSRLLLNPAASNGKNLPRNRQTNLPRTHRIP